MPLKNTINAIGFGGYLFGHTMPDGIRSYRNSLVFKVFDCKEWWALTGLLAALMQAILTKILQPFTKIEEKADKV